jgi:hypothetical protein
VSIDDPISPRETAGLQLVDQKTHASATVEMEHEGDVLKQQPTRSAAAAVDESKDVADKARLAPADAGCPSSLTQVLTREPCGDELSITETLQ